MGDSLTPKQEKFARCVAEGMSQADAYRTAYNPAKAKPETIHNQASATMRIPKVSARVMELKQMAMQATALTIADLVDELEHARKVAEGAPTPQSAAMVAATLGKAKLLGLEPPQKVDMTVSKKKAEDFTDDELAELIARSSGG